ncbi:MAG: ABC transporter ATP-binding protein [Lachnospiraceae bacterium]|nr:ABC transporter ATP-binding protein [Lachnospiraceae bacterium]
MELLMLNKVSYQYEKTEKPVLKDITCAFETGRLYCVTGASGAGKSTLLSLIAGLDIPTSGEILYDGQDIAAVNRDDWRSKKIGVIFQSYNLLQNATATENVLLSMNIAGNSNSNSLSEAYELLSQVGINKEKANRKILKLSGGEQQRVAIARAIAGGSPILAADEPTGNLDGNNEKAIMEIFQQLAHDKKKCVIVVTHSQEATTYADEVIMMQNGCLKEM